MSEQSQKLRDMNLEIQQEQMDIKADSEILKERKRELKKKEKEYLALSLVEFEKSK